jgi:hypothetical protein
MSCHNNGRQNCNIKDSKEILKKCSNTWEQQHQINITLIKKQKVINIHKYLPPVTSVSHLLPKYINNTEL